MIYKLVNDVMTSRCRAVDVMTSLLVFLDLLNTFKHAVNYVTNDTRVVYFQMY